MSKNTQKRSHSNSNSKLLCKEKLWSEVEIHFEKCMTYTNQKEWLGAYYNIILAGINCKQYVQLCSPSELKKEHKTEKEKGTSKDTEINTALSKKHPELSLQRLMLVIPYYQHKVRQFQAYFGCKDDTKSTENELQCDELNPVYLDKQNPTLFTDVIGNQTAIQSIEDTIINPHIMPHLYPIIARGILFYGPPGTGKTLLARATAYELDRRSDVLRVLFFAPTAEQLKGKYVGETEKKIVTMFKCASKKACDLELKYAKKKKRVLSILFIDEIDSIARRRTLDDSSGVSANATNTFLQMMDGMNSFPNVIVIAATNLPWNLDTAILRRFNQKIYVPLPLELDIIKLIKFNIVNRLKQIIHNEQEIYSERTYEEYFHRWRGLHDITDEELEVLASDLTTTTSKAGYSPRDIARLCNTVFKNHSTEANYEGGFFKMRINRTKQLQLSDNEVEIFNALENKYASLATYQIIQLNYPDIVDMTESPIYPEVIGYPLTITILSRDSEESTQTSKTLASYSHYTLISYQTHKIIKLIDLFRKLDKDLNVYFKEDNETSLFWSAFETDNTQINEGISPIKNLFTKYNFIEKEETQNEDKNEIIKPPDAIKYIVYKVFKMKIMGTTCAIPVFLEGNISRKYLDKLLTPSAWKSASAWYQWEKKWTLDMHFIYENINKLSFYYKNKLYNHDINEKTLVRGDIYSKKSYEPIVIDKETFSSLTKKALKTISPEKLTVSIEDTITTDLSENEEIEMIGNYFITKVTSLKECLTYTIQPSPYAKQSKKVSKSAQCFNTKLNIDTFLKVKKEVLPTSTIENINALDEYRLNGTLPKSVK